jgi:hypothetical protein
MSTWRPPLIMFAGFWTRFTLRLPRTACTGTQSATLATTWHCRKMFGACTRHSRSPTPTVPQEPRCSGHYHGMYKLQQYSGSHAQHRTPMIMIVVHHSPPCARVSLWVVSCMFLTNSLPKILRLAYLHLYDQQIKSMSISDCRPNSISASQSMASDYNCARNRHGTRREADIGADAFLGRRFRCDPPSVAWLRLDTICDVVSSVGEAAPRIVPRTRLKP